VKIETLILNKTLVKNMFKITLLYWQENPDSMNPDSEEQYIVRARGLPWSATAENVADFFSG